MKLKRIKAKTDWSIEDFLPSCWHTFHLSASFVPPTFFLSSLHIHSYVPSFPSKLSPGLYSWHLYYTHAHTHKHTYKRNWRGSEKETRCVTYIPLISLSAVHRRGANQTVICTCKWSLKGKTSDVLLTETVKSGLISLNDQCSVEGSMIAFMILFLSGTWQGRMTGDRNGGADWRREQGPGSTLAYAKAYQRHGLVSHVQESSGRVDAVLALGSNGEAAESIERFSEC